MRTAFVENAGQEDSSVLFHSIHPFNTYVFKDGHITVGDVVIRPERRPERIVGEDETGATFSVFKGGMSVSGLPVYGSVRLVGVAEGTEMLLTYIGHDTLEIQLFLSAESPDTLRLTFPGASISGDAGTLRISRGGTVLLLKDIGAFEGSRRLGLGIGVRGDTVLFRFRDRRHTGKTVLDPITVVLVASAGYDYARDIALTPDGNVVIAGYTYRAKDFAPSRTLYGDTGNVDVFVTKLSGDLSTHIATAIVGSPQNDYAYGVGVDASGYIYVAGMSEDGENYSSSRTLMGTQSPLQAVVTKLSPDLSTHVGTAVISSSDDDFAWDVVVVGGNVYVAGSVGDIYSFAPSRSIIGSPGGVFSVFVSELSSDLSTHIRTVIFGSSGMDWVRGIDTDSSHIFVGGYTYGASDFGPSRTIFGTTGSADAFVARLPLDLSSVDAVAIVGGSGYDRAEDIDLDDDFNVLLGGTTGNYSDFAPSREVFGTTGGSDAFITKLSNDLTEHVATAIVAGSDEDYGYGVDADPSGDVFLVGKTYSSDIAPSRVEFQYSSYSGNGEAFMTVLTPDMATHITTYVFKSSEEDGAEDVVAVDSLCPAYITGWAGAGWNFTQFLPPTFGSSALSDAFVIRVECPLGQDDELSLSEREGGAWSIKERRGALELVLGRGAYVGYDVYDASGKLLHTRSVGFLKGGTYTLPLPKGPRLLFVVLRVGEDTRIVKVVRR